MHPVDADEESRRSSVSTKADITVVCWCGSGLNALAMTGPLLANIRELWTMEVCSSFAFLHREKFTKFNPVNSVTRHTAPLKISNVIIRSKHSLKIEKQFALALPTRILSILDG